VEHEDLNDGNQLGMSEAVEARADGERVDITTAYSLGRVKLVSNALPKRVIISQDNVATGVELADERVYSAKKEVIVSVGSFRTPQILMLSGIGSSEELTTHGTEQIINREGVGKNLWDHLALFQGWKLRNPEIGAALGIRQMDRPSFHGKESDRLVDKPHPSSHSVEGTDGYR
jgi:choline dehydrogenase-like flavoprotein